MPRSKLTEEERKERDKERSRRDSRLYYQRHPEKVKALNKKSYEENKESRNAYSREYYKKNKEKIKAQRKGYEAKNKEKIAARAKLYSIENRDKIKDWRKGYLLENKAKYRKNYLKREYGITMEDYENMLIEQDGMCKCCGLPGIDNRDRILHIDHNHETNKVRGLLCDNCNRALGMVKDSIKTLESMIEYLKSNQENGK